MYRFNASNAFPCSAEDCCSLIYDVSVFFHSIQYSIHFLAVGVCLSTLLVRLFVCSILPDECTMIIEFLFLGVLLVDLFFIFLASRLGKEYLIAVLLMNIMLSMIFSGHIVHLFGFLVNLGILFYVPIFVVTNVFNEHYSKKETKKITYIGFFSLVAILVLLKLGIVAPVSPETPQIAAALDVLFGVGMRVTIGIVLGYSIVQLVSVPLYQKIERFTKGKYVWLRHNAALVIALGLDSAVFCPIVFYGTVSMETLLVITITSWLSKIVVAIIATPVIYLSKKR